MLAQCPIIPTDRKWRDSAMTDLLTTRLDNLKVSPSPTTYLKDLLSLDVSRFEGPVSGDDLALVLNE